MDNDKAGLILLHGLGMSFGPEALFSAFAHTPVGGLGLSSKTIVKCPKADHQPVGILPPTLYRVCSLHGLGLTFG